MKMDKETIVIFALVASLFIVSAYAGVNNREEIFQLAKAFYGMGDYLKNEGALTLQNKFILFLIIWLRNTLVATMNIALGPILGIFPIFTVFFNGYIIGGVMSVVAEKTSIKLAIIGILPHGIIELPTFLYSAVIGIKLARRGITSKFKGKQLTAYYIDSLKLIPKLIAPLFLLAAFLEAFITTYLLSLFTP